MNNTSKKIFREQTRLLYANSAIPISVSIVAGAMLCWSLQPVIDQTVLVTWFTVFFVITLFRLFSVYLFNNGKTGQRDEEHWHRRFLIYTYAVGAVWAAASFFMFPEYSLPHQTVFFIIILGMAAGGISSLCPSLPVVGGFLSLLLIPLIVKLLTLGDAEAVFNGSLLLIFWGVVLIGAIKINENISENILLHLESVGRERILAVSEERYRHIFSNAPLGILHYDATGTIVDCNEAFINLLGSSRDLLIGMQMLVTLKDQKILRAINDSLADGEGYYEGDYTSVTSNITTPIRAFFKAIKSSEENIVGGVGIVEDFSEKKQSEQLIQYQASYDPLTGLPNRRMLLDRLSTEMARARRHGHYGALLFIDLDNFKTINDSLGHSVGDELLKVVAKRITECIREEDTAARMGGDEFIIIITELGITIGLAAYKLRGIAEQLSISLSAPCQIAGHDLHITPSVGVSIFPTPNKGVDDVLKQADSAMYRAKAAGRNTIRFFLPHMQEAADERLHLNTELRKALDCNQFSLYYQPQVNKSRELVGAEALLRWHHPERGVIPNETFIDIAEETGLMPDIGQWVLREACQSIKKWTDAGQLRGSQTISINISGKEIASPGYVDRVIGVLEETGVNPNHLGIELTESSLVSTNEDIVDKIVRLRQIGIKFSIDDFGTGYSSLSYLKSLPLNTLKIDRSFVNDIKDGGQDVVLIDTIILMAHNLGLEVIAEGVETEQELHYLNTRGCIVYQGFWFSKPVTAEIFTEMLKSGMVN